MIQTYIQRAASLAAVPALLALAVCGPSEAEQDIKENVVNQLVWDARVDSTDVEVSVDNHTVTLGGQADSFHAKDAAETAAWSVRGVYDVKNNLEVSYPVVTALPADAVIESRINDMLFWDAAIDASDIQVSVEDGRAILNGTADSYWEKSLAAEIAEDALGVVVVDNDLAIAPSEKMEDERIAEDVGLALERTARVEDQNVDVRVSDGVVTLTGVVDSSGAKQAAAEAASVTQGVQDVRDRLVVNPG